MLLTHTQLADEFDFQVNNLLQKKYPHAADMPVDKFLEYIEPLRAKLATLEVSGIDLDKGTLPFVIVVTNKLVDSEEAMSLVTKDGKNGVTILRPHTSNDFQIIQEVRVPNTLAYLLLDIDRGKKSINLPPNEALLHMRKQNRQPLTIDEGVAIVTHHPEFLIKNNCFSLLASRTGKDQRVPAIWINSKKEPNLGWCWDGNPHTWLGSASCDTRIS